MKVLLGVAAGCCLLTLAACGAGDSGGDSAMTPEDFMRAYERASAAHDLEATMAMVADDAVYFFSNETAHIGKEAVRNALKTNFELIKMEKYEIADLTCIDESDRAATCLYAFYWTGEINGQLMSGGGRGTAALRRNGDSWKIVHEHLSRGHYKE